MERKSRNWGVLVLLLLLLLPAASWAGYYPKSTWPTPSNSDAAGSVPERSPGVPLPPVTITPSTITVTAGATGVQVVPANPNRKTLLVCNISTGWANIGVGTSITNAAGAGTNLTSSNGYPIDPADTTGHRGGCLPTFDGAGVTTDALWAVSAAGTVLIVWEGN